MKLTHYIYIGALTLSVSSCFDLNKEPEGVLSTVKPFTGVGEMTSYLDQFYESGVREQGFNWTGAYIASGDLISDNMSGSAINTRLNGDLTLASAGKLNAYTQIRNVNFMLTNLDNCDEKGSAHYKQCVGEAHYFKAWFYYTLFKSYGQLTWLDKPLDPNTDQMLLPRANRTVIADSILSELDKAIANLNEQNSAASMRVHRDVARALKAEVALYEATWEKYHKAKNDPFFDPTVTSEKISDYLNQCVEACKAIVDRNVWSIYTTNNAMNDYRQLFQTEDLSNNKEVLWFKRYDGTNIGNNVDRYLNKGGGSAGITASLVDDYLTIDGQPFVGTAKTDAKKVFAGSTAAS